jgi:putative intracellular protease/amidase
MNARTLAARLVALGAAFTLVTVAAEAQATAHARPLHVGILVFDGVQLSDVAVASDILGRADATVPTIAQYKIPIQAVFGVTLAPDYTFANHPPLDVLIIPGGPVLTSGPGPAPSWLSESLRAWVKKAAAQATKVLGVGTGSILLAMAGVLDSVRVAPMLSVQPLIQGMAPRAIVVRDKRYVDAGTIVTAGGLSAIADAAFHIVAELRGEQVARDLALLSEYHLERAPKWVRSTLPDQYLTPFPRLPGAFTAQGSEGNEDAWERTWVITPDTANSDIGIFATRADSIIARNKPAWARTGGSSNTSGGRSEWAFTGADGSKWNVIVTITRERANQYLLGARVQRVAQ